MWTYQLKVIFWKNVIIRKRHWFLSICEAAIPVLLFFFIAYGRSKITSLSKQHIVDVTYNEAAPISFQDMGFNFQETNFYYAPTHPYYGDIVQQVKEKCQIPTDNVLGFKTESDLFEKYAKSGNGTTVAIIFNSDPSSPKFDYTIRIHDQYFSWKTGQLYRNSFNFQPGQGSDYTWKGFLVLQTALDISFIEREKENQGGRAPKINWESLEFPYPPYKSDSGLSSVFIMWLPLITLFSFIFVCPVVLKRVVEEKYTGIKELMRMVGMKSWMLWFGWFVHSVIPMLFSVLLIILIMKVDLFQASYPAIEYTNAAVLFLFLMLYCVTITINCFFLSTLFYKPTLATLVGILFWILSYFVPKYLLLHEDANVSFSTSMLLMLLPNMAIHFGYSAISNYEVREIGVQWSNWYIPGGNGSNEVTMLNVCLMLLVDCFVYLILALYVDQINPGKYGVPQSVFFPVKWICSVLKRRSNNIDVENESEESYLKKEVEKGRLPRGIELVGLTKSYGKNTVVKHLSLDIYQDQITVLLGHNGAGKSTTMGMITGMIKKTSGRIIINGKEIDSRSDITQSIGLCPQYNLFFSDLTVLEHLMFFAMLRGLDYAEAKKKSKELLETLNIYEKRNDKAKTLSGGMKRKLCLGMAVIGDPKILILDEPSSGLDPQSRRHMWDLLLKWRIEKTILITTHFMEEADALGDWIAIMNEGKLLCYGTPMYLKKVYGTGSNLILLIKDQNVEQVAANIEREIRLTIPNVKCKSINGNEVQFLIPSGNYVKMFEHLESNKEQFHIENISFNNTTLEDVFLNSKIDADKGGKEENDGISLAQSSGSSSNYFLTLQALLFKRYRFIYRKFMSYIIPSCIALGFLLLCIFLGQNASDYSSDGGPALKMHLSSYGKSTVYFSAKSDGENPTSLAQFYQQTVEQQNSIGHLVNDVNAAIIKEGIKNFPYYRHHMIAAAQFLVQKNENIDVTVMYNNWAIHSLPISLNIITNALAKMTLGSNYSITTTNNPLPSINSQVSEEELSEFQIGLLWLIVMPLGFLFFLGSFIFFPFMEMSTNFTQIQFMCGVPQTVYWLITFLCDCVVYVVFAVVMAVITLFWTPFRGNNEFDALLLILLMYGFSGIPYAYVFARKKSFSASYALFIILGIMLGVLLTFGVLAMEMSQDEVFIHWAYVLKVIFTIFCPPFGLTYYGVTFSQQVIKNYNFNHMGRLKLLSVCSREASRACCKGPGPACDAEKSYINVLAPDIWYMFLGMAVYLLLNTFLDSYARKYITNKVIMQYKTLRNGGDKLNDLDASFDEDDGPNTDTLRVRKLKKSYSGRQVVNNVSLSLKKGECMGILGVNGAGKTTTFRMLTREEVKDNGEIKINDVNVDSEEYLKKMGYCPQNDALNYSLTGRDILKTVSMLRGIKDDSVVNNFLETFGLKEFADIPCNQYSGGNKRKLSFAVAVIGFPEFILLDEPTNGVDPLSRRKFWTLIKDIKEKKQISFILTSHSMAECEAVCNDLKIMKQGTIKKQGTISKLKNDVSGFNVMLKLKQPNDNVDGPSSLKTVNELKAELKEWYKDGEIRDEHSGLLHFYIKSEEKRWSGLFKHFEDLKERNKHLIEDYSISEASLEDVFLSVAQPDETLNSQSSLLHV